MVWEIVFVLVILKLPVAYVCWVIWWAVKSEPELGVEGENGGEQSWTAWHRRRRGLRGRPAQRTARRPDPHGGAHTSAREGDRDVSGRNTAGGIFGVAALVLGVLGIFFVPFALVPIGVVSLVVAILCSAKYTGLCQVAGTALHRRPRRRRLGRRGDGESAVLSLEHTPDGCRRPRRGDGR